MTQESNSQSLIDGLRRFDSATIANAIEAFSVRDPVSGYASMDLRCQFPDRPPMVGYAVTCTADTSTPGDDRPMRLVDVVDVIAAAPKPCVLVIQYKGPDRRRSCFVGDMFCTWLQNLGGVGMVTDGGYRDQAGIAERAPNLQIFAGGTVVSHGHGAFLDFNVTVSVCGLTIRPGDLLHGDANGLVSVPEEIAAEVIDQAAVVREAEAAYFDFLQGKNFSVGELKRRLTSHDQHIQTPQQRPES
jgi:regulator of RNase E activity RraA